MATSHYTGLYQFRSGSITLTDGQFAAPRLNQNGELVVEGTFDLGATVFELSNSDALAVSIVDSSGDQIASFGGGTQYNEGDTDATPTGNVMMWRDSDGDSIVSVSDENPLPVEATLDTTGLATSANQTTIIGHVDGLEGLLGTIDADTSTLASTDFMLGTDFSSVFGTNSLVLGTQADNVANTSDGVQTSSFLYYFDGSAWDRLRGDSSDGLLVNLGGNNDVTVTGTVTANLSATDNAVLDDIATDTESIKTAVETLDNIVNGNEAQVDIVGALPAGTNTIGATVPVGRAAGGNSVFNSTDLDESEEQVKATGGTIYAIYAWNTTDAPLWLKLFNATAASVTVGSTSADYDIMIPANANSDGAGFVIPIPTGGWPFSTAITLAATTGVGATNSGAPGANACGVLVFYV